MGKLVTVSKTKMKKAEELCQRIYSMNFFNVTGYSPSTITDELLLLELTKLKKTADDLELRDKKTTVKEIGGSEEVIDSQFYRLRGLFRKLFDAAVFEQSTFRDISFYYLFSQFLFKKYSIKVVKAGKDRDLRIHATIIASSGTGKSTMNDFNGMIGEKMGLTYTFPHIFNDVSAIGTYNFELEQRNKDKKLQPDDERYISPETYGYLYNNDLVIFDEGENVLRATKKTEWIQMTLQRVANVYGTPTNMLENDKVRGNLQYQAACSFFITSYHLAEFKETLLKKGLLQRTIVFIDENIQEKREKIMEMQIDAFESLPKELRRRLSKIKTTEDRQQLIVSYKHEKIREELDKKLKKMNNEVEAFLSELRSLHDFLESVEIIFVSEAAKKKMKEYYQELKSSVTLTPGQKEVFNDNMSRIVDMLVKIAACNAVERRDIEINERDMREAYKLLHKTTLSLIKYIQENVEFDLDKKYNRFLSDINREFGGKIFSKGELNEKMSKLWRVSIPTVIDRSRKLQDYFVRVEKGKGNKAYFKIKI